MPQSRVRFIGSRELHRDLPKVLENLENPNARCVLTIHSKPKAVLIGAEAFLSIFGVPSPEDRLLALQLGALVQGLESSGNPTRSRARAPGGTGRGLTGNATCLRVLTDRRTLLETSRAPASRACSLRVARELEHHGRHSSPMRRCGRFRSRLEGLQILDHGHPLVFGQPIAEGVPAVAPAGLGGVIDLAALDRGQAGIGGRLPASGDLQAHPVAGRTPRHRRGSCG